VFTLTLTLTSRLLSVVVVVVVVVVDFGSVALISVLLVLLSQIAKGTFT
jgi:hypothetical protein